MQRNQKSKLIELVKQEAISLKANATKAELKKLNINTLDSNESDLCIYGQMTGHCESDRAHILIEKCCERVYKPKYDCELIEEVKLNGKPKNLVDLGYTRLLRYVSPIETFIFHNENVWNEVENNKILIDFLKGKTTEMNFI